VRGIGRWTVEMLLMFRLGRPDVLPVGDFGVCNGFRLAYGLRGMPTARALAEFGTRWAPYRSVAAWYLWRAVDLHRAGKLPAPTQKTRIKLVKVKKKSKRKTKIPRRQRTYSARRGKKSNSGGAATKGPANAGDLGSQETRSVTPANSGAPKTKRSSYRKYIESKKVSSRSGLP
jgi:hypothetical protein